MRCKPDIWGYQLSAPGHIYRRRCLNVVRLNHLFQTASPAAHQGSYVFFRCFLPLQGLSQRVSEDMISVPAALIGLNNALNLCTYETIMSIILNFEDGLAET